MTGARCLVPGTSEHPTPDTCPNPPILPSFARGPRPDPAATASWPRVVRRHLPLWSRRPRRVLPDSLWRSGGRPPIAIPATALGVGAGGSRVGLVGLCGLVATAMGLYAVRADERQDCGYDSIWLVRLIGLVR